jgi:hypothetical protein
MNGNPRKNLEKYRIIEEAVDARPKGVVGHQGIFLLKTLNVKVPNG